MRVEKDRDGQFEENRDANDEMPVDEGVGGAESVDEILIDEN